MRGPGDFFGTKQHGFIKSKVVDLVMMVQLLEELDSRLLKW